MSVLELIEILKKCDQQSTVLDASGSPIARVVSQRQENDTYSLTGSVPGDGLTPISGSQNKISHIGGSSGHVFLEQA